MGNLKIDPGFFFQYLISPPPIVWLGLWVTVWVSTVAMLLGIGLGFFIGLARMSEFRPLRNFAQLYVWFWRGTPLLVQLVLVYTGVAAAGLYLYPDLRVGPVVIGGALQAAILTLALNEAAYMAEIFRSAIGAIDKGQSDAARAIGMRPVSAMRWIILPQAMRIVMPPLGNEITLMIKSTSLLSVIGIREFFGTLQSINGTTFRTFELFSVAAIWYLVLTSLVSIVQRAFEARLSRHESAIATDNPVASRRSLLDLRR